MEVRMIFLSGKGAGVRRRKRERRLRRERGGARCGPCFLCLERQGGRTLSSRQTTPTDVQAMARRMRECGGGMCGAGGRGGARTATAWGGVRHAPAWPLSLRPARTPSHPPPLTAELISGTRLAAAPPRAARAAGKAVRQRRRWRGRPATIDARAKKVAEES